MAPSTPDNATCDGGEHPCASDTQALRALTTLCVLDTLPDERFDRITRLACRGLGVPTAMVSVIDRDRHWLKLREGAAAAPADLWMSFCALSIRDAGPLIVADTHAHPEFAAHPLVCGAPYVRFYAGQVIRGPDGRPIGALCIADQVPRRFGADDERQLVDFAALVEREIDLLEHATTDELTRLSNRRGFGQVARHVLSLCRRTRQPAVLATLDLDDFKPINDQYGHEAGDQVLREFGRLLFRHFRHSDVVARLGGDEFAVLCSGTTSAQIASALERLGAEYAAQPLAAAHPGLSWSTGLADFDPESADSIDDLIRAADDRLYRAKAHKHDVVSVDPVVDVVGETPAGAAALPATGETSVRTRRGLTWLLKYLWPVAGARRGSTVL